MADICWFKKPQHSKSEKFQRYPVSFLQCKAFWLVFWKSIFFAFGCTLFFDRHRLDCGQPLLIQRLFFCRAGGESGVAFFPSIQIFLTCILLFENDVCLRSSFSKDSVVLRPSSAHSKRLQFTELTKQQACPVYKYGTFQRHYVDLLQFEYF